MSCAGEPSPGTDSPAFLSAPLDLWHRCPSFGRAGAGAQGDQPKRRPDYRLSGLILACSAPGKPMELPLHKKLSSTDGSVQHMAGPR